MEITRKYDSIFRQLLDKLVECEPDLEHFTVLELVFDLRFSMFCRLEDLKKKDKESLDE